MFIKRNALQVHKKGNKKVYKVIILQSIKSICRSCKQTTGERQAFGKHALQQSTGRVNHDKKKLVCSHLMSSKCKLCRQCVVPLNLLLLFFLLLLFCVSLLQQQWKQHHHHFLFKKRNCLITMIIIIVIAHCTPYYHRHDHLLLYQQYYYDYYRGPGKSRHYKVLITVVDNVEK